MTHQSGATRPGPSSFGRRALIAATVSGALSELLAGRSAPAWEVRNYRGRPVSLVAGPVVALAGIGFGGSPRVPVIACAGSALMAGRYDDVAGARPAQAADKGFAGHVAALRAGRVSSGLVKIVGVGGGALTAACLEAGAPPWRIDPLLDGLLIAASANLVNLLDLRPGRALKGALLVATAGWATAPSMSAESRLAGLVGTLAGALPADLAERIMLGDAGANTVGALLGLALADRRTRSVRVALLVAAAALTATSERVSFSAVIDRTPWLRTLDRLGRQ